MPSVRQSVTYYASLHLRAHGVCPRQQLADSQQDSPLVLIDRVAEIKDAGQDKLYKLRYTGSDGKHARRMRRESEWKGERTEMHFRLTAGHSRGRLCHIVADLGSPQRGVTAATLQFASAQETPAASCKKHQRHHRRTTIGPRGAGWRWA